MDDLEIAGYVDSLEKEVLAIRKEALDLTWVMRGGLQYNDTLNLSLAERKLIAQLSKENLETTKKSGLPFF